MKKASLPKGSACCGCAACQQRCPRECIAMLADGEGFLYPSLDVDKCVGCGLCEKSCPSLTPNEERNPEATYAVINLDDNIRLKSSSGGVFTLLAEACITNGGVVFAARFDDSWKVVHDKVDNLDYLKFFRGSKYSQSCIGDSYKLTRSLLDEGRSVMFVGTPCQIAGINRYLDKPSERLLTVDFVCHGVPSPAVWNWYVKQQSYRMTHDSWLQRLRYWLHPVSPIRQIEFRNKEAGWKQYKTFIQSKDMARLDLNQFHFENAYMRAFLTDLDLRPSCHECRFKSGRSHSDMTIADFWNVHKVVDGFDDDKGTSLVMVNTRKGAEAFKKLSCRYQQVDFHEAIQYNPAWSKAFPANSRRAEFFRDYQKRFNDFI